MGLLIGVGSTRPSFAYDHYYGIEFDTSVSNPDCTRIGKAELHASLPVQSKMRRCLLDDDGVVVHYLNANNSALTDTGATADLTGASGNVMVEIPEFYVKFEMEGTKCRVMISEYALPGFTKWSRKYVSAYEAALDRTNKVLYSCVNETEQFRGGNNSTAYDADDFTLLGRPATSLSLANYRTYARTGRDTRWNCNTYDVQKTLYWLFAIEYATLNSQKAYNAEKTSDGYRQGGLGNGVTDINGTKWNSWCAYNPFVPCGYTNALGNATGVVGFAMPSGYGAEFTTYVPSYRGVENPFGHIWKWTDGILVNNYAMMVCDDPANYASSVTDAYVERGTTPSSNGYVKQVMFGEYGDIMPLAIGGGSTTYLCDYFYIASGLRGVRFRGFAIYGTYAGFVYANANNAPSNTNANIGSRQCLKDGVSNNTSKYAECRKPCHKNGATWIVARGMCHRMVRAKNNIPETGFGRCGNTPTNPECKQRTTNETCKQFV